MSKILEETKEALKKGQFISETNVPKTEWGSWRRLFEQIPSGQALMIEDNTLNYHRLHANLSHYKVNRKMFLDYSIRRVGSTIYIIHHATITQQK